MSEIPKLNNTLNPLNAGPMAEKKNVVTEEKFREVSDMYEKHFIREMMKQMRATVHESGFIKQNNAEKIFQDQLDDQYAEKWGKSGGIGLSNIIHDQLMQKYGTQLGLKPKIDKPVGPIELTSKTNFSGAVSQNPSEKINSTTYKFQTAPDQRAELKNPWVGTLLDKKYLEMDQMQYQIQHDNGLESLILTRGTGLGPDQQLSPGDKIQAGQQLGWVSSSSPLFWTVKPNVSE
ncbi:MAG: rod-binding protein [Bdellovibrio sp.]|nr:rod-binding protein [Bdellovibrio sp.]